ncbi:MAG: arsenite methyltransferase [candidate division KSB1 bacterium]|nr:arsenite methyltransferase [candidate division KSB1 bacterium]MDZ7275600.1 arsenite methyltransferase [candidate division KSB1 bacterium]MDZ7284709.1 arsenite methyltransferase [candidate division KSB1 bacterium]MDZ7297872.1 arsenite methyltransferase [candidate division KSB1 bacterium]MDZ7306000.1 arsenite methyltransferase [candidate division KSB1 bacterium]
MPETTTTRKLTLAPTGGGCCGSAPAQREPAETDVKALVKDYYARAVSGRHSGCCSNSAAGALTIPRLAGYRQDVFATVPADAAEKSFGCGDPLAFAKVQSGEIVLDIGSGAGIDCFIAAQKVGPAGKVIGLDMTPAMLEAARRNAAQGGYTNVEFRRGEAENMPVADNSVDWVISNCVINLSPDKPRVFSEIQRVLKPGGRIAISDIVAEALPDFIRNDKESYCGCVGGAVPTADYLRLLTQAGLTEVRVDTRLDYDEAMIRGLVLGDDQLNARYGALIAARPELLQQVKIASVKVVGRKPLPHEQPAVDLRTATTADYDAIAGLLAVTGLPDGGLREALTHAIVAEHYGHLIGVFALERYGSDGLLRSFAVAPAWRGKGIGKMLWQKLLTQAQEAGVRDFYLLTTTIAGLAARAGFEVIPRDDVPAAVRRSSEFGLNQCATATCMRLRTAA